MKLVLHEMVRIVPKRVFSTELVSALNKVSESGLVSKIVGLETQFESEIDIIENRVLEL